jgi:hypothetical protein
MAADAEVLREPFLASIGVGRSRLAAIARLDDHVRRGMPRIGVLWIVLAGRPVDFVAVGAFTMEDRSSVAAVQQFLADTASALIANIQHKQCSFGADSLRFVDYAASMPPRWGVRI